MIDLTDCIAIGTITKMHGIHGQFVLSLDQLSVEDIKKLEPLFIIIDGLPVPFFISDYQERTSSSFLITFDEPRINYISKDLINNSVYVPKKALKRELKIFRFEEDILGFTVTDKNKGVLGIVSEFISIQQNPLLKIIEGKKELLLPIQSEFIINIDKNARNIDVEVPVGLIDLN